MEPHCRTIFLLAGLRFFGSTKFRNKKVFGFKRFYVRKSFGLKIILGLKNGVCDTFLKAFLAKPCDEHGTTQSKFVYTNLSLLPPPPHIGMNNSPGAKSSPLQPLPPAELRISYDHHLALTGRIARATHCFDVFISRIFTPQIKSILINTASSA